MDMFRLPQHVEDEFQTFLMLLCPNVIVHRSLMPKESLKISSILVKDEKIDLFNKVKKEIIKLPNKGKEETKELQSRKKENKMLQILKEETLGLPKTKHHQDESIITYIDKIYKASFNKFIYFHWILKLVVLIVGKSAKTMGQHTFLRA
jgi:hypothetical protein